MEDFTHGIIAGIVIGLIFGSLIGMTLFSENRRDNNLKISQQTGNDFCAEVTGNESSVAKDWWDYAAGREPIQKGGLVCELPSYDSTHNIVIKKNSE